MMPDSRTVATASADLEDLIRISSKETVSDREVKNLLQEARETIKRVGLDRVNQFAVRDRLEGLQERWAISFDEEAATALEDRIGKLYQAERGMNFGVLPECLHFILCLSHGEPVAEFEQKILVARASNSLVENLQTDILYEDLHSEDELWKNIDHTETSSEDSLLSETKTVAMAEGTPVPEGRTVDDEISSQILDNFTLAEDLALGDVGFVGGTRNCLTMNGTFVTESILVRESIHMLCGLSTDIYDQDDDGLIAAKLLHSLGDISLQASNFMILRMAAQGSKCTLARRFAKSHEKSPVMQRFQHEVEIYLSGFDNELSMIEQSAIDAHKPHVSMIQLLQKVSRNFRRVEIIMAALPDIKEMERDISLLDKLVALISEKEAIGGPYADADLTLLIQCFGACFNVYWRPIEDWLCGLNPDCKQVAFAKPLHTLRDPSDLLWSRMYSLDKTLSPSFLRPYLDYILTAGKTAAFLARLSERPSESYPQGSNPGGMFLFGVKNSFFESWQSRLDNALRARCLAAIEELGVLVRRELIQNWRLGEIFEAFRYIYLAEQGSINDKAYSSIFEIIDRDGRWIDRFLLTDVFQRAFQDIPSVAPSRISVSIQMNERIAHARERSVIKLESIKIVYALPWPIANLIDGPSLSVYQHVAQLLFQIARARYCLDQQVGMRNMVRADDSRAGVLFVSLQSRLRWFVNSLHSHIIFNVFPEITSSLKRILSENLDLGTMIEQFRYSTSTLQLGCFLSASLMSTSQAIVSLLDLTVILTDMRKPDFALLTQQSQSSSDEEDESKSQPLPMSGTNAINAPRLIELHSAYKQLLSFVVSGAREAYRATGDSRLNIFAEDMTLGLDGS